MYRSLALLLGLTYVFRRNACHAFECSFMHMKTSQCCEPMWTTVMFFIFRLKVRLTNAANMKTYIRDERK